VVCLLRLSSSELMSRGPRSLIVRIVRRKPPPVNHPEVPEVLPPVWILNRSWEWPDPEDTPLASLMPQVVLNDAAVTFQQMEQVIAKVQSGS
jgi:hypothetical protein